jgi:heptosyltransferase-2
MVKDLVIMPNWVGDCVLALSVIHRTITMRHTAITLCVHQPLAALCSFLSGHAVIPYKRSTMADYTETLRKVRHERFDSVYVLPPSFSSALFAFLTGAKKRRGISGELRGPLLTRTFPRSLRDRSRHITYEYAAALETDFVPPEYWQGVKVDKPDNYAGSIVFCPGSMYGPAKRWAGFRALAESMPGKEIIVLGANGDAEAAEAIKATAPDRVRNLCGETSLIEAAKIISHAGIVVSNDSGLMHLAGYVGTPVVCVFGSTSPAWTRPLGSKVRIAQVKTECSPCYKRACRFKDHHCLTRVTPESVLELMDQLAPVRA